MRKKYFDRVRGHYVIREDISSDTSQSIDATSQKDNNNNNQQQENQPENKSVESNADIQRINTELSNVNTSYENDKNSENERYNTEKANQTKLLNDAMKSVEGTDSQYDSVQTNTDVLNIKQKLVDLELSHIQKICSIELDHATKVANLETERINVLSKINNESWGNRLPSKYKILNESNVQNAKIYIDLLIGDDMIITGMPDFKNVFKDSDMVYGKDKKGYFVICIDREDFEKLYKVLMEIGYRKDEIFSVVMTQVLDRSDMIAVNN